MRPLLIVRPPIEIPFLDGMFLRRPLGRLIAEVRVPTLHDHHHLQPCILQSIGPRLVRAVDGGARQYGELVPARRNLAFAGSGMSM